MHAAGQGPCYARAMAALNLALRFLLELAGLAAIAYFGWRIGGGGPAGLMLGLALAVVFALVWWRLIAPKARSPIPADIRPITGSGLLLLAAGALGIADQHVLALILAVAVVVNTIAIYGSTERPTED